MVTGSGGPNVDEIEEEEDSEKSGERHKKRICLIYKENSAKKNLNFTRIAKTNMNFGGGQKNTKLSLTLELINN